MSTNPRTFLVESTGVARDIQTNAPPSFDHTGLADEMDNVVFPGEYVTADVVDGRIVNISATERPVSIKQ